MVKEFEEFILGNSQADFEERLKSADRGEEKYEVVTDFTSSFQNNDRVLESIDSII